MEEHVRITGVKEEKKNSIFFHFRRQAFNLDKPNILLFDTDVKLFFKTKKFQTC